MYNKQYLHLRQVFLSVSKGKGLKLFKGFLLKAVKIGTLLFELYSHQANTLTGVGKPSIAECEKSCPGSKKASNVCQSLSLWAGVMVYLNYTRTGSKPVQAPNGKYSNMQKCSRSFDRGTGTMIHCFIFYQS